MTVSRTPVRDVFSWGARPDRRARAAIGRRYSPAELQGLHQALLRALQAMAEAAAPGAAVVGATISPDPAAGVTVIPIRDDAAGFRVTFRQTDRTTMLVYIGAHGEFQAWEGYQARLSLSTTAQVLFTLALEGRYREEVWADCRSGRYEGGQSYFLDAAQHWRALGPLRRPQAAFGRLELQDRRYAPY
jgi:hypothetical protein